MVYRLFLICLTIIPINKGFSQSTITDIEGNTYKTITIGNQEWMAENLKASRFKNGEDIYPQVFVTDWLQLENGYYAVYEDNALFHEAYGKLYNWYAVVDIRGLCPEGWRVPNDNDWQQLLDNIDAKAWGNNNNAGAKLKSRRQENSPLGDEYSTSEHPRWNSHSVRYGTDDFGFNALPGGVLTPSANFNHIGSHAYFWSSTEGDQDQAWARVLISSNKGMSRSQYTKGLGMSVRCIKGDAQSIQVPQLITHKAYNISTTWFTIGGEITSTGGAEVLEKGIVWSTDDNPTIENNTGIIPSGSGVGAFTQTISGLPPGSTYWVRAYATNSAGTAYGIQKRVGTLTSITIPTLTTRAISNITTSSVTSGGIIISDGGSPINSKGVVWGINETINIDNKVGITNDGEGSDSFISFVTPLQSNTSYYVRAYASNNEGISYGNIVNLVTLDDTPVTYALFLTSNPSNGGSTQGGGSYQEGATANLSATPADGYQFVNWTRGTTQVSTQASFAFTMPGEDVSLVANFELIPAPTYTLSITANPSNGGSALGGGAYQEGATANLSATPADGYQFVNWTRGTTQVSTQASFAFTMPSENVSLVANFELIPAPTYTLSITANPSNGGSALGGGAYQEGATANLSATPADGYQFVNWTRGTTQVSTQASFAFTMPGEDVSLVANFELIPAPTYTLSITANPSNGGSALGGGAYQEGATANLSATPADGYQFVNWTRGTTQVSTQASFAFTMPSENVSLVANFSEPTTTSDGEPCEGLPSILDYDNNTYNTVYIGGQCWIKENLKTTTYSDGTPIPHRQNNSQWTQAGTSKEGAYSVYSYSSVSGINSEEQMLELYGALYNWYAVDNSKGLCPTGWRVATESDWDQLINYLGAAYGHHNSSSDLEGVGNVLKSCRQVNSPLGGDCNTNAHPRWDFHSIHRGTNAYNFTALPGGYRIANGTFMIHSTSGFWWTQSVNGHAKIIFYDFASVTGFPLEKEFGLSVRCIKE